MCMQRWISQKEEIINFWTSKLQEDHGFLINAVTGKFFQVETLLDTVKWDDKGLAVAIAQNVDTGAILMQGFANREALATTISSRKATFYSRSRSSLWTKGETSMNFINVHDIFLDCDRDSVRFFLDEFESHSFALFVY